MNIRIGKYRLTSDKENFIVSEFVGISSEPPKKPQFNNYKFFLDLEDALECLSKAKISKSDVTKISQIQSSLRRLKWEVQGV